MSYKPINIIQNAIKNNKLSHAYLFYGDRGVDVEKNVFESLKLIIESNGKKVTANSINEINYYDLQIISPSKDKDNQIIKEHVDEAILKLFESSLEKNSIKFLYIRNIDSGNKHSLNRLLKFIEEPTDNLIIFMSTNYFEKVISTIKSRSQNIFIKRESLDEKIKIIKPYVKNEIALVANIFANIDQIKETNMELFDKTYQEIIEALEISLKDKYYLKEKLFSIWNKNNNDFILNILQFFVYQLMVEIDKTNPLFPSKDNLIFKYKIKNLDCYKIQLLIEKTKNNLQNHGNFTLHKINFLNQLEKQMK